uniref:CSON009697 protein n=1 Tax=Culicoides sonorensis TaxID=179676 RepID=A0A336M0T4_CULSO
MNHWTLKLIFFLSAVYFIFVKCDYVDKFEKFENCNVTVDNVKFKVLRKISNTTKSMYCETSDKTALLCILKESNAYKNCLIRGTPKYIFTANLDFHLDEDLTSTLRFNGGTNNISYYGFKEILFNFQNKTTNITNITQISFNDVSNGIRFKSNAFAKLPNLTELTFNHTHILTPLIVTTNLSKLVINHTSFDEIIVEKTIESVTITGPPEFIEIVSKDEYKYIEVFQLCDQTMIKIHYGLLAALVVASLIVFIIFHLSYRRYLYNSMKKAATLNSDEDGPDYYTSVNLFRNYHADMMSSGANESAGFPENTDNNVDYNDDDYCQVTQLEQ